MAVTEETVENAASDFAKIAEQIDVKSIFSVFISLLRAYGAFAKQIGNIEKTNKASYEALLYFGQNAPQIMNIISKKSPPEEFGAFMQLALKLMELSPKLDTIATLPADEKIAIGTEIERVANEFDELWKQMQDKNKQEKVKI